MGVSKVTIKTENGEETIMDTTGTTVTPKTLARGATAINAAGDEIEGEMPIENVLYIEQNLTSEQKAQARANIGLSNVDNVKQYSASNPPPYPVTSVNGKTGAVQLSASDVGARPSTWIPSASEVGADPSGSAASALNSAKTNTTSSIGTHNTSDAAHSDIRLLITNLTTRINGILDSTDVNLDQLSELVAYIKANRTLIESVTTNKVNVSDIIDNLTTSVSNKPLSAKQGVQLKALIDAIKIPVEVAIQSTTPTEAALWIDPDGDGDIILAEIDDEDVSEEKTWSSSKINREMTGLNEKIVQQQNIYYKAVDGGLYVKTPYSDTKDIIYYLCKHGANNIFDFYSIGKIAKSSPLSNVVTPTSYLVQTSGDWHAPYVVKAVNNADGQMLASDYFTGGNHGYDNTATGVPTARTDNLKMFADGKILSVNDVGYCDSIRLEWDNYVQAYNTTKADGSGREVLREHIIMIFDGYRWETETTIYPLEDIVIKKWYGLQFFTLNYLYVAYIGGETGKIFEKSESSESGNATTNAMRFFNLEDTAIVEFDTLYDLGARKKASGTTQGFFARASYNKAYGTVIDGSAELVSGGAYSLRGSYIFKYEIQQTPIYESNTVVSLLRLNRTETNTSAFLAENCESLYINPSDYGSVAISGNACVVSDLTDNSITVKEGGTGGKGCAFPLFIDKYYGKTLLLTFDATGTTDTRFRLMCLGNGNVKYGDIDNKKGTVNSATIVISSDGNTITLNGTALTSNGQPFTNIAFNFGAATGKTVSYKNVMLVVSE